MVDTKRVRGFLLFLLLMANGIVAARAGDCIRSDQIGNSLQTLGQVSNEINQEIELPSPSQRRRIEEITTYFENSTIQFQYDYLEDIHDGQGLTGGRIGFISSQDMATLVELYCPHSLHAPLCHYLPILRKLQASHDPSTKELGSNFFKAWKLAAKDIHFRQAQDQLNSEMYLIPAFTIAAENNIHSQLGKSILYDTNIQQGLSWTTEFAKKANEALGHAPQNEIEEAKWLAIYLELRSTELTNAADKKSPEIAAVWADTVYRVDALKKLLEEKNMALRGPLYMDPKVNDATSTIR